MAALCLDAIIETLRPLCCRRTLRLQGDLCRFPHNRSPQAVQPVVKVSVKLCPPKQPTVYCPGF